MSSPEWAYAAVLAGLEQMGPARLAVLLGGRRPSVAFQLLRDGDSHQLTELSSARGMTPKLFGDWSRALGHVDPDEVVARHGEMGVVVEWKSGLVLDCLEGDPEPPDVLFRTGVSPDLGGPCVAIVGTRRCSSYGRSVASELGAKLAGAGVTIISGVATGIDGAAQRAALDQRSEPEALAPPVIGVVGSGLDWIYPAPNRALWQDLCKNGTMVSEYPLGTPPARWRFPARNRIIVGLSDVVVVVESGESGGSMHTVESALERGTPVMAVPGPITNMASKGTNRLLAEGCAPVCGVDDVLAALGLARPSPPAVNKVDSVGGDRDVLEAMGWEPTTIDELVLRTGLGLDEVASGLVKLAMGGSVQETGGWWERC
jgi:DNA processing protein